MDNTNAAERLERMIAETNRGACMSNMLTFLDTASGVLAELADLRAKLGASESDLELYEGMKEGAAIRIADLEVELADLREENQAFRACFGMDDTTRVAVPQNPVFGSLLVDRKGGDRVRICPSDDPETDCTDFAHPAWWRGNDHAYAMMCKELAELLDGKPLTGSCNQPWQGVRERIADLRDQLDREKREHLATQELHERSMRMIEDAVGPDRDKFDGWRAEVSAKAIADLRAKVAKFEDETPVDEAWLREQFGEPGNWFGELFWAIAPYAKACVADDGIEIVVGLQRVSTNPTRGQLAKLIDGLGVRV